MVLIADMTVATLKILQVCRRLYRTATGILVNADINGSLNILRKSNLIDTSILQGIGCLAHPQRVRII